MKLLKLLSLAIIISFLASFLFTPVKAQETNSEELNNVLVEFETDKIDAKSLNIEELNTLPGEFKYNWQIFKENAELFFTFDKAKKIEKLEKISNRRLLEAKQLSETGTNNATDYIENTLKRYKEAKQKISDHLANNPELKTKLLEKLDANELKHQQILSTVIEKLRNKIPEDKLNNIENIKKDDAFIWYNINKDKTQARLEKAIDNNNIGSKFKQLKNISTLEELSDTLPKAAQNKIEAAKDYAENKLAEKLRNANDQDIQKFEKYINNIKTPELNKQKFIDRLKNNKQFSPTIRKKAKNIFNNYSNTLQNKFENLNTAGQKKFLNQFENKLRSHPANIQFLKNLNSPENKERIQDLLEIQIEGVKEKIQRTNSPTKLKSLEQNLQNIPVLKRQIQQREAEIRSTAPRPSLNIAPTTSQ